MGKQQGLHCSSHNRLALVGSHLEFMRCSTEVFRHEIVRDAHRHEIVECVVVDTLDGGGHF